MRLLRKISCVVFLTALLAVSVFPAVLVGKNSKPPLQIPPVWRAIEVNLADDAIVALVDLKITVLDHNERLETWQLRCTGDVKRFIAGSDQNKKVEFECSIYWPFSGPAEFLPLGNVLLPYIDAGKCDNCLVVYHRKQDGSLDISRLHPKGLDFVQAYEWLESTKDRKEDRVPLAVMVILDKNASQELKGVAYRTVGFSDLAFQSKYEIITNGINAGKRDDATWGAIILRTVWRGQEENNQVINYLLEKLVPTKDVRDANVWIWPLEYTVEGFDGEANPDLAKKIAATVEKHEVTPAPDLPNEMYDYNRAREMILKKVAPRQAAPEEKPAPPANGEPAPPAEGGTHPPASGGGTQP